MDAVGESIYIGHQLYVRSGAASSDQPKTTSGKIIGLVLAISSGLFIGVSFVLKKHGLLKANAKYNEEAGEGYGYLKNVWWWSGMILMIVGEICNFAAYLFADAILVTPLGALSVVITAILSSIFLKERLSFVGKIGCFCCIVGSVVIAANAPEQASVKDIYDMKDKVISPGFLSFAGVILVGCTVVAFWLGPKYGKKTMLVYLTVCSLIGGLSVSCIQGIGAAITAEAKGEKPQFTYWFTWVLIVFVVGTLVTEIIFLNKALNLYNAALVTPTYYVYFTSATIVSSAVLYQGFKGTVIQILTVVLGFLEICAGVVLLQLSKSAKDVPDTAVFKGDLDQVRTVAEQEEPEYEPRADAIRGGSAIIRSISKVRQSKQMEEAKRIKQEHEDMQPIGENEQIEFDGIRRRRTTIMRDRASTNESMPPPLPGTPLTPVRRNSKHPPLGMSRFPDEEDDQPDDTSMHPGFFANLMKRNRSSKALPPTPTPESVPLSPVKGTDGTFEDPLKPRPQYLGGNLPSGFASQSQTDTSYKSPASHIQWASSPALQQQDGMLTPPPPQVPPHRPNTPGSAKRQFSFTNVFHRRNTNDSVEHDNRPVSKGGLSFMSRNNSKNASGGTEEERAGLVKGDSSNNLPTVRSESPPSYSNPDEEWQLAGASSSPPSDSALPPMEGSFMDVERTRLPTYSPTPSETIRQIRRDTDASQSPRGGRSRTQSDNDVNEKRA